MYKYYHRHPITDKRLTTEQYFNYVFSKAKKEKNNTNETLIK